MVWGFRVSGLGGLGDVGFGGLRGLGFWILGCRVWGWRSVGKGMQSCLASAVS